MTRSTFAMLALCSLLAPATLAQAPRAADLDPAAPAPNAGERLLQPLAAGLARALGHDAFRQRIFEELEGSPYVEGRVAFKRLLAEDPVLREEVFWRGGAPAPWPVLADSLPELELYFPFRAHRAIWRGGSDVQVAVPLAAPGRYRLISPDGTHRTVGARSVPEVPTLLLARSEIDFDDLGSALDGGERTGAGLLRRMREERAELAAGEGTGPRNPLATKSSGVDPSNHTYFTTLIVYDDHDPWRGSMEIEVFGSVDGSYSGCTRVTGIEEDVEYWYSRSSDYKVAYAVPTGLNTVDLAVYEDDDTGCVLKSGDDYLGVANLKIEDYFAIYGTSTLEASVEVETLGTTCGDSLCNGDESKFNCCTDCATCGDGQCNSCENGTTCSADCYTCGNGFCEGSKGETQWNCQADCSSCGNGICESGETESSCPLDCCGEPICPE